MRNIRNLYNEKLRKNVMAKKSLGQNFLKSASVARALVDAARVEPHETVVEVGPGRGAITEILLARANHVIAVEKDARMIEYLKEKFSKEIAGKKLTLMHDDILKFNPTNWKLKIGNWKLIGSIPYYITGHFLKKFLSLHESPNTIALIIQKEVAERIVARNGKQSILSISVRAYGVPKYIKTVSKKLFSPEPKVDSAIFAIEHISKKFFDDVSEERFFALVRAGFSSKRKKVISNVKKMFPQIDWETVFSKLCLSPNVRAEDLSLSDFKNLSRALQSAFP